MRTRSGMLQLTLLGLVVVGGLVVSPPAHAKGVPPVEVQVTDAGHTVRVLPPEFLRFIEDGGASGHFGIFRYAERPADLGSRALTVTLFVYESKTDRGALYPTLGPDTARRTEVVLDYYPTGSGAAAKIVPGGAEFYRPGRWVRLTPTFASLVERALVRGPSVAPVTAPPFRSAWVCEGGRCVRDEDDPVLRFSVVPLAGVAAALGLLVVLLALRSSRKARERETMRLDGPTAEASDRAPAR